MPPDDLASASDLVDVSFSTHVYFFPFSRQRRQGPRKNSKGDTVATGPPQVDVHCVSPIMLVTRISPQPAEAPKEELNCRIPRDYAIPVARPGIALVRDASPSDRRISAPSARFSKAGTRCGSGLFFCRTIVGPPRSVRSRPPARALACRATLRGAPGLAPVSTPCALASRTHASTALRLTPSLPRAGRSSSRGLPSIPRQGLPRSLDKRHVEPAKTLNLSPADRFLKVLAAS